MTQILRQSTQIKVVIGPVVAVGDGFTPVTTLSLATADEAEIIKSDAAAVTDISGATFAAITSADGYYNLTLTTSLTDTVGLLTVLINDDSLCLPVRATFQVVEEAIYDALFAATANGFSGAAGSSVVRANDASGNAIATASALDAVDNFVDTEIGAIITTLGTPVVSIAADIASVESQTDDIGIAGAGLTAVPWNGTWDAQVEAAVQAVIETNHLDHLFAVTYDPAAKPGAADALLNELIESDAGVSRYTANALEQAPSGGAGTSDWTADERTAIRAILGIPASGTIPDDPIVALPTSPHVFPKQPSYVVS